MTLPDPPDFLAPPHEFHAWERHPAHMGDDVYTDPETGETAEWEWRPELLAWLPIGYQLNADHSDWEKAPEWFYPVRELEQELAPLQRKDPASLSVEEIAKSESLAARIKELKEA